MRSTPLSATLSALVALATAPAVSALETSPCRQPGLDEEVRCATLELPEDRGDPEGRRIAIPIVVVPARSQPAAGAVAFIAGGPGDSSIAHVAGVSAHLTALRDERDLLFVDTRGIGGPDRLFCRELAERGNMQGFYEEFLPPAKVARCRQRLAASYDLTLYTTDHGVDDLEAVRRALGYGSLDLYGVSYGTRFALVYARRHPESVRTLTLIGVVPTGERLPLDFARHFDSALAATFTACAAEPACAERFPGLDRDLAAAVARLAAKPAEVELVDPRSGETFTFRVTPSGFAQALRYMLYIPSTALLAPLYVHQAAAGDFRPVAEAAQIFFGLAASDFADGYYLSASCSEDVPFIGEDEIELATRGTLLGDFRIRQQRAACAAWTARPVDHAFLEPVLSPRPALLVSGERDPVTPAANAEVVARTLPNSLHLVVPDGGHDVEGLVGAGCPDRIAEAFIRAGSVEGLDTSCLTGVRRPPFVLALPSDDAPELSRPALERLAATYASADGLEAEVAVGGDGRLRITLMGKPPMLLEPRSERRFGIAGLPPTYALEFVVGEDGTAVAVELFDGSGERGLRLDRRR